MRLIIIRYINRCNNKETKNMNYEHNNHSNNSNNKIISVTAINVGVLQNKLVGILQL
jgi:hypothetical protein